MLIGSINDVFVHLGQALVLAFLAVALLALARVAFEFTTSFDSTSELVDHPNTAFGIYLASFLSGTAIALAGTIFGRHGAPLLSASTAMFCEGVLLIVLMRLGIAVNDRLVLTGFSLATEISSDRNRGAAFCVGGSCLATGFILNGSLTGYSDGLVTGLRDTVILWTIGQAILLTGAVLYRRLCRFDIHQLIQFDDNAAAGLRFGAFLVGLGLVIRAALLRAPMTEVSHAIQTLVLAIGGLLAFALFYPIGRHLVLWRHSNHDEVDMRGNMSVSVVDAAATLSVALLIAHAIERTLGEMATHAT